MNELYWLQLALGLGRLSLLLLFELLFLKIQRGYGALALSHDRQTIRFILRFYDWNDFFEILLLQLLFLLLLGSRIGSRTYAKECLLSDRWTSEFVVYHLVDLLEGWSLVGKEVSFFVLVYFSGLQVDFCPFALDQFQGFHCVFSRSRGIWLFKLKGSLIFKLRGYWGRDLCYLFRNIRDRGRRTSRRA